MHTAFWGESQILGCQVSGTVFLPFESTLIKELLYHISPNGLKIALFNGSYPASPYLVL